MSVDVLKVPKTPEEELQLLIETTREVCEQGGKILKSNPFKALYHDGQLTFDFIMKEIELIAHKKSNLPKSKREAITALVSVSSEHFEKRQAAATAPSNKDDLSKSKNESND